jgi:hypothetical protein
VDELTRLSRLREELPPASDEVLAQARGRLLERAAERKSVAGTRPRRRRRLALGLAAVAAAAGLVVAGPVGLDVLAPDGRSLGATAEAAGLLRRAAINARDPVVGPTQYLKVTSRGVHLGIAQPADGRDVRYYSSDLMETWIPADPSRPWVLRRTAEPYRFLSAEDERALRAAGAVPRRVELLRAKDGAFYGPVQGSWQTPTRQFLAGLPRDPDRLLRRIYRDSKGQGPSKHGEALVYIADVLRSGLVPADLRAALFRAATNIPGVEVVEAQANLDGRKGVAVGRYERNNGIRQEIIFNPDTGEVIGERLTLSGTGLPKDLFSFTSVRTRVVDHAP